MSDLVKPIKHRYCGGKGYVALASGANGHCFKCDGTGLVEGDRATLAARKAAATAYSSALNALQDLAIAGGFTHKTPQAYRGLGALRELAPERYTKAIESINTGHPGVFDALVAYYHETKEAVLVPYEFHN